MRFYFQFRTLNAQLCITYAAVFITITYALDNSEPLFEARNSTCAKICPAYNHLCLLNGY